MTYSLNASTAGNDRGNWLACAMLSLLCILLTGCGSGSGTDAVAAGDCPDCGTVLVTVTDADGDFLNYTVDVASITLEKANGDVVETLPNQSAIDFTQYVNLTELFTAAQVPNGVYVGGSITLDYAAADVQVEVAGESVAAEIVDPNGAPLGRYELEIELVNDRPLVVRPGLPSLLSIDFDLAASHEVDISQSPPLVTANPFIVAELEPVDEKDLRVRGPLVEVNQAELNYFIRLRPFHVATGDFGRAEINIDAGTHWDIDDVDYAGEEGLRVLATMAQGTPTVALGTLDVASRTFTAAYVAAGSSVPGHDLDAVIGNVVAREDDVLWVKGATIVRRDTLTRYRDTVRVTIGPDTIVKKQGEMGNVGSDAVSIGQRVQVFGQIVDQPSSENADTLTELDATNGRIRMRMTHIAGATNLVGINQLNLDLQRIDRHRVNEFRFAGTGSDPSVDADPADYEVLTSTLGLEDITTGTPVQVFGFVRPFGAAPADFEGRSVVDLSARRAALGVGWGPAGTAAPFLSIGPDGIVIDLDNPDLGERHHIKIGPVVIDLTALPAAPIIQGTDQDRRLFAILHQRRVVVFRDFDRFIDRLATLLDGSNTARSMHAVGGYDDGQNNFNARYIAVHVKPLTEAE